MVSLLRSSLGSHKVPVILNGELLQYQQSYLLASFDHGKAVFTPYKSILSPEILPYHLDLTQEEKEDAKKNLTTLNEEAFMALYRDKQQSFFKKYASHYLNKPQDEWGIEISSDPFTNALVITCAAFRDLIDERKHSGALQFTAEQRTVLNNFIVEYAVNWFYIFVNLINRKLSARNMTVKVRGHFIGGLFQPLIVSTDELPCPLQFGQFNWIIAELFSDKQTTLSNFGSKERPAHITAVAMTDLAKTFNCQAIPNMDRKNFVLMVLSAAALSVDKSSHALFASRYGPIFSRIVKSPLEEVMFKKILDIALTRKDA